MKLNRESLVDYISELLPSNFKSSIIDDTYLSFHKNTINMQFKLKFRLQFESHLWFQGFSNLELKKIESNFKGILKKKLLSKYDNNFIITPHEFYEVYYDFQQEINSQEQLETYLSEFIKCLEYHEKEVFPKLLDIEFLAEYVGSLPFERQSEIPVGGKFPVNLFKKLAILKWGNQESRYLEYKKATLALIEKYKLKKPANYIPEMHLGFDELVHHVENEPNPFSIDEA